MHLVRAVIATLGFAACGSVYAECWLVGNLAGQAFKSVAEYQAVADGLSGKVFSVAISGSRGTLTPSNGMACSPVTTTLLACTTHSGTAATMESWSIDASAKKAIYTQVRSGHGAFDGASVFVGDVLGLCK